MPEQDVRRLLANFSSALDEHHKPLSSAGEALVIGYVGALEMVLRG